MIKRPPRIVSDPDVMGGRPCVSGTPVPADQVIDALLAGASEVDIRSDYPSLPDGGVDAAASWAIGKLVGWRRADVRRKLKALYDDDPDD